MTLTQLRYLVAIADAGLNITQAAERVHATQPGLSKQLKQLEDELGFQLFLRRGRSPTRSRLRRGSDRAPAGAAGSRQHPGAGGQPARGNQGELAIGTTHTRRATCPPAIGPLRERFPEVSIHIVPTGEGEALAELGRGADLAPVSSSGAPPAGGVAVPLYSGGGW